MRKERNYSGPVMCFMMLLSSRRKVMGKLTLPFYLKTLVHQVRDWFSGAAAYFGWMREAKRENTRCGLRPMSDKAASQKTRSPEGCDENGPAAALLLSHVSIQTCSFVAPCRRLILIATPLNQSRTWCTSVFNHFEEDDFICSMMLETDCVFASWQRICTWSATPPTIRAGHFSSFNT